MEKAAFIIAEYNPFHNGHQYQIEQVRKAGAQTVVAVMSGNFVQRGIPAIFDKTLRAEAAIHGGVDLVIELPLKYAVSGAFGFAHGAVKTIKSLGVKGTLAFGASAELETILQTADCLSKAQNKDMLNSAIKENGKNYASISQGLLQENNLDVEILEDANNVLAIEYIKAIKDLGCELTPFAVKRIGNAHDSDFAVENYASAKFIRELIANNGVHSYQDLRLYCNDTNAELYYENLCNGNSVPDLKKFDVSVMTALTSVTKEYLKTVNGVNQGLENRIWQGIYHSNDFIGLCDYVKSKRFTHSRIRRCVLSAYLGIRKTDADSEPSYIRVLGFNQNGKEFLRIIKDSVKIPIITNISQVSNNNNSCLYDKQLDCKAGKLYELCKTKSLIGNPEFIVKPIALQK